MPSNPDPGRSQRLEDVYARAERLRRQRRTRLGTGALLASLAVFTVGLLVGSNLGIPQQLTTIGRPDPPAITTTTGPLGPTTTGLPVDPPPDAQGITPPDGEADVLLPATTPPPPPPVTTPPTTTRTAPEPPPDPAVPPCRNSRDPACGPLRYEPPPVNEPMTVEVAFAPRNPEPGEEVTFTVRVRDDGPAKAGDCVNQQTYGEADESVGFCTAACALESLKYGSWDPPPPENTSFEESFRHSYEASGMYTATFAYNVGADCSFSPYRSQGEASVTVTVR